MIKEIKKFKVMGFYFILILCTIWTTFTNEHTFYIKTAIWNDLNNKIVFINVKKKVKIKTEPSRNRYISEKTCDLFFGEKLVLPLFLVGLHATKIFSLKLSLPPQNTSSVDF